MTTRLKTPMGAWIEGEALVSPAFISLAGAAPQGTEALPFYLYQSLGCLSSISTHTRTRDEL